MDNTILDQAIYERYIIPTKRERTRLAGLEFELPIVNRKNAPVDFNIIHKITDEFIRHFSFHEVGKDNDWFIYSELDEKTRYTLSFD